MFRLLLMTHSKLILGDVSLKFSSSFFRSKSNSLRAPFSGQNTPAYELLFQVTVHQLTSSLFQVTVHQLTSSFFRSKYTSLRAPFKVKVHQLTSTFFRSKYTSLRAPFFRSKYTRLRANLRPTGYSETAP